MPPSLVVDLVRTERSFRWLWLSQVVSELGDWFQIVAVVSMFPTKGDGATIIAGLVVTRHVVAAALSPIAGVVADRWNRGTVMIAADLARAVVMLGFLFVRGAEDVVLVFVLSILLEALSMFFEPARGAAIPQVLPTSKLYTANALSGATWSVMLALGALAGGATSALLGRRTAFIVNALSFALSALFVARARIPNLEQTSGDERHPLRDVREGIAYMRTHPAQAWLLVLKPGALVSGGVITLVGVFADRIFPGDNALTMGFLLGGRGLGALVLPFVNMRVFGQTASGTARALAVAFGIAVLGFAAFAVSPAVPFAAAALFFGHGATSTIWVGSSQLLQMTVPNRVLGRVLSVDLLLVTLVIALANTAVAVLLRAGVDPRNVALCLAGAFLVPLVLWARALRRHVPALEAAARETPVA